MLNLHFCKDNFEIVELEHLEMFSNPYMGSVRRSAFPTFSIEELHAIAVEDTEKFEEEETTGILPHYGVLVKVSWFLRDGTSYRVPKPMIVYSHPGNRATYIIEKNGMNFIMWAEKTSHIFDQD